jgi:hypothetical protein
VACPPMAAFQQIKDGMFLQFLPALKENAVAIAAETAIRLMTQSLNNVSPKGVYGS